jgi:hypothetical protein
MKLLNNSKRKFITSVGDFGVNKIVDFSTEEALTLLKYPGVFKISDLEDSKPTPKSEYDLLKEKAASLDIEFKQNISKAALVELIEKAESEAE